MANTRPHHRPSQRYEEATDTRISRSLNEPTKRELYADLAQAVANTAAMTHPDEREDVENARATG